MRLSKQSLAFAVAVAVLLFTLWRLVEPGEAQKIPPEFVLYVKEPKATTAGTPPLGNWDTPTGVVAVDGDLFVLDTGNDRILKLDKTGRVTAILCEVGDCGRLLKAPQAITAHEGLLYVANTGAGQVVVLSTDGSLISTIEPRVSATAGKERFAPSGIVVSTEGDIYVADTGKDLVLRLSNGGETASVFMSDKGESDKYRVSKPIGLSIDVWGNIYIANSGNGRIRKYSPEGRHLQEFAMRSNPAFFSPAYLAIDISGNVYFTDNRSRMVYVYSPTGDLVGTVGLLNARRVDSPGVLRDPQGLCWEGTTLYVADRTAGLFGFQIDPSYWRTKQHLQSWSHP